MAHRAPRAGRGHWLNTPTVGSYVSGADYGSIKHRVDIIWHERGRTTDAKLDRLITYREEIDTAYATSVKTAVEAGRDPEPIQRAYLITISYFLWIICIHEQQALVRRETTIRRAVRDALNEDFAITPTESLRGRLQDLGERARLARPPIVDPRDDIPYVEFVLDVAGASDEDFQRAT